VVLARTDRDTLSLHHLDCALLKVKLQNLVRTLSQLSLAVKLEATAEYVKSLIVADCCVALTAEDLLLGLKFYTFPSHGIAHYPSADYLLNWLLIHAAYHIG